MRVILRKLLNRLREFRLVEDGVAAVEFAGILPMLLLLYIGSVEASALVVAGGVAANGAVRSALQALAADHGLPFVAPPLWLCTDNAAMIGWAGAERFAAGLTDPLDTPARPRWPLDPDAAPARGAGVKA